MHRHLIRKRTVLSHESREPLTPLCATAEPQPLERDAIYSMAFNAQGLA
jgi:hypothetical protein